jgi:hypothetical protein
MLLILTAKTERLDDRPVTLDVLLNQVIQQPTTLANHFQKAPARMMVFFVSFEVVCQIGDPFCQKRYLHLRGTSVTFMTLILINDFLFTVCAKHDNSPF